MAASRGSAPPPRPAPCRRGRRGVCGSPDRRPRRNDAEAGTGPEPDLAAIARRAVERIVPEQPVTVEVEVVRERRELGGRGEREEGREVRRAFGQPQMLIARRTSR